MNPMNKIFIGMIGLIIVLVAAIAVIVKKLDAQKDDNKAFQQAMSNKFDTLRNNMGQQTASVPAAVFADIKSLKQSVDQQNKAGANIQSKIDNWTQSLILLSKTIGTTIKGTTKITGSDSIKTTGIAGKKDSVKVYPIYGIDTANKFYSLKGNVGYKHFELTPRFLDSTEIKGELVGHGLFKPGELTAFALSKNPFATTTQFKALVVKKIPAPIWKYVFILSGFAGGVYIGQHVH